MFSYKVWKFKEKSRSLQNQPNRMEVPAEQSLEFLMYGPNALKYNEFKHSQVKYNLNQIANSSFKKILSKFLIINSQIFLDFQALKFSNVQELDRSKTATDWEGLEKIKRNLKQDHQEITQRLSKRFSRDFPYTEAEFVPSHPGGLSDEEHFYFKPNFTRDDANQHLTGLPEGNFHLLNLMFF